MLRQFLLMVLGATLVLAACRQDSVEFNLQYACLNRALPTCVAAEEFAARIAERTDGKVRIEISALHPRDEQGAPFGRLAKGTLDLAEVYRGHFGVTGDATILEISDLWGLYPDIETQSDATKAIREITARIVGDESNGIVLAQQVYPSNFLFSAKPLRKAADVEGLRVRSHNIASFNLLAGMGAYPKSRSFASVYHWLDVSQIDAAVSCSSCGSQLKWYEVADYLVGPLPAMGQSWLVISKGRWEELPQHIQEIIREEALRHEVATRTRSVSIWQQQGVDENTAAGMEHIELTPELKRSMRAAALSTVLPSWIDRSGGPKSKAVEVFNRSVAPIVGVTITAEGKVREIE